MNKMYYYIARFGEHFNNFAIFNNYAEAKQFCDIFHNQDSFIIQKELNLFEGPNPYLIML